MVLPGPQLPGVGAASSVGHQKNVSAPQEPESEEIEEEVDEIPHILQRTLQGHSGPIYGLTLNKTKNYLLSASGDRSVRLWNPRSGLCIARYDDIHREEVGAVAVAEDSTRFYTAGSDKFACCVDVTTKDVVRKFHGHEKRLSCCELMAEGSQILVTGSQDGTVRIWDARFGGGAAKSKGSGKQSGGKAVSSNCIQLLADAKDAINDVCVVDGRENGASGESLTGPVEIVTASMDGRLRRYDVRKGLVTVDPLGDPLSSVNYSSDGNCLLVSGLYHRIFLLEKDSGELLQRYEGHKNCDFKIHSCLDPTDAYVFSGSEDGKVYVWELVEGECKLRIIPDNDIMRKNNMLSLAFRDEKTLLCGGSDGKIRVFGNK
ncbi:unnamed protein product [Amoebophrya sp. A25]|nr:unnamed protein product [Amoebophrya sp. A25]|eukprot:GSA25T00013742001.1